MDSQNGLSYEKSWNKIIKFLPILLVIVGIVMVVFLVKQNNKISYLSDKAENLIKDNKNLKFTIYQQVALADSLGNLSKSNLDTLLDKRQKVVDSIIKKYTDERHKINNDSSASKQFELFSRYLDYIDSIRHDRLSKQATPNNERFE